MRTTVAGEAVCNLRLATTDKWKDKTTGDARETTEWHRVVLYRRLSAQADMRLAVCIAQTSEF